MYRIAWASLVTGHEGVNAELYSQDDAERECARLNLQYAGRITHWMVETIERIPGEAPAFAGCC